MQYTRLSEGLTRYKLIPSDENIYNYIKNQDKDYYIGIYQYNEEHFRQWKATKTVAGIEDTTTSRILFDFDDAENIEAARNDAVEVVSRLMKSGIKEDNIQASFSGMKGFCIEVNTTDTFTPEEFKNITFALAGDLITFDRVVNDSQRLIRVVGTRNPKSNLYKIPLSVNQLTELPIDEIKQMATNLDNIDQDVMDGWVQIQLPEVIKSYKVSKKEDKKTSTTEVHDLDMTKRPKWLSEAKYALQEGYFGAGERNTALMILAASYKGQGMNKEIVYRALKGVAEVQAKRNNVERYSDEEIYNNIVEVVFAPTWKGGVYSYENTPLLREVTARLGLKIDKLGDNPLIKADKMSSVFKDFAENIDKNTIKLGIPTIDNEHLITTSMLVGMLAPPSAGKTSITLGVLNHMSKSELEADFYSLDMGAPLVFQRLLQKHTGLGSKKIFEMYRSKDPKISEFNKIIENEYGNINFCFRSGLSVSDIREHLTEKREKTGQVSKLLIVDYIECLQGPYSDSNANTALIAQQLKDIANDFNICVIVLLQPQKHAGDPSSELLTYRNIKGASAIEQACSFIISLWRPGFSPKNPEDDKFMSMAVLKNRMGGLGIYDFGWDGLRGDVVELDEWEKKDLEKLRKRKAAEKAASDI